MTETAYITIYSLLITTVAGMILSIVGNVLAYLKGRDNERGIAAVAGSVKVVSDATEKVHGMLNSQLTAYKEELAAHYDKAVEAAVARGIAIGEERERVRSTAAAAVVAEAVIVAADKGRAADPLASRLGPNRIHDDPTNAGRTDRPA